MRFIYELKKFILMNIVFIFITISDDDSFRKDKETNQIQYSFKIENENIKDKEEITPENMSSLIIKKDGEVSDSYISLANNYFEKIPENLRNILINEDWNIYITDKNLAKEFFAGSHKKVAGVTIYDKKTIYIEARSSTIRTSLIHEVGHALDSTKSFISNKNSFNTIYKNERDAFVEVGNEESNYGISSRSEYFAETFNQFVLYPEQQKINTPKTYEYMEKLVKIS